MPTEQFAISWSAWLMWGLAFIGFPIGGLLARAALGPITGAFRAGLAGLITGAVIGVAQWLALATALRLSAWWIFATSAGMGIGMEIGTAWLGTETSGNDLLRRAGITGLCIGIAQWFLIRTFIPAAALWIAVVSLAWVIGWWVTRRAGVDLSQGWSVFGASGALTFQLLTGLALYLLLRLS